MTGVTFITGNQDKADFLAKFLDYPVAHFKLELEEIQSLDFDQVAEHKVMQAYEKIGGRVLVEDVGLSFKALGGKLPGTFTKWFIDELGLEGLCRMLDNYHDKGAIAQICYAYYDGNHLQFFEGEISGEITNKPRGDNGFGFDPIFKPKGVDKTYAEMNDKEKEKYSLRTTTVYPALKRFLTAIDKS